jgi:hypothetical protein
LDRHSLGDVDGVDDFPLAKRLVGVLEEKAIHRTWVVSGTRSRSEESPSSIE